MPKALAEALQTNRTLRTLALQRNEFSWAFARALSEALERNDALTSVDVSSNKTFGVDQEAIAKMLETNQTLKEFRLEATFVQGCPERATTISGVNWSGIRGKPIMEALKNNASLTLLDVSNNALTAGSEGQAQRCASL